MIQRKRMNAILLCTLLGSLSFGYDCLLPHTLYFGGRRGGILEAKTMATLVDAKLSVYCPHDRNSHIYDSVWIRVMYTEKPPQQWQLPNGKMPNALAKALRQHQIARLEIGPWDKHSSEPPQSLIFERMEPPKPAIIGTAKH